MYEAKARGEVIPGRRVREGDRYIDKEWDGLPLRPTLLFLEGVVGRRVPEPG